MDLDVRLYVLFIFVILKSSDQTQKENTIYINHWIQKPNYFLTW